jgi:hypothetical protein
MVIEEEAYIIKEIIKIDNKIIQIKENYKKKIAKIIAKNKK